MESEGHEEKYRAAVDGGNPGDEPVGQRWARSSLHYGDEGVLIHPPPPRCLRAARYGRTTRDLRRADRVSGGSGVSGPISVSEKASEALSVVGRLNST